MAVSPLLFDALEVACVVAVQTAGIVDPTIGSALIELGYDRDFDADRRRRHRPDFRPPSRPRVGGRSSWTPSARTVAIPVGVHVDLGATAKALAADRAAGRIADALGCGVLVNLGGDVAVAGPARPGGGRRHRPDVHDAHRLRSTRWWPSTPAAWPRRGPRPGRGSATVASCITSSTRGPARPAEPVWSLVSTTAPTCVEANAWSTAAVVWGDDAVGNLADPVSRPGWWTPTGASSTSATGRRARRPRISPDGSAATAGRGAVMLATSSTTLWYTTRATGIVALVLLTVTMVLGILTAGRARSRSWPAFAQADLHKRVSLLAMVFLAIHVLTAVLDTYVHVGWPSIVVPFTSPYRPAVDRAGHGRRRPDGRRGRVQRPAPADQRPDLAGHPLVGLWELAGGHGPLAG